MTYDAGAAERITDFWRMHEYEPEVRQLMGGLCYLIDGQMRCGLLYHKQRQQDLLMLRIGAQRVATIIDRAECSPMDFTGGVMEDYVFVDIIALEEDEDLHEYLTYALEYQPPAK